MTKSDVAVNALADLSLLNDVVKFKQRFYHSRWANYDTAKPGTFRLLPTKGGEANLKRDYIAMRPMFFSDPPKWREVLTGLQQLEKQINALKKERET